MARPLRILHTADSHIGADLPARPRRPGRRRGDDLVDAYAGVLGEASAREVDLVIHAGDLFNRSKPSSRALAAAAEPLLRVAVAGIPVVIVPGNHERSRIPSCLLLSHPNIHIVSTPRALTFHLRGTSVGIAAFPCLRRDSAGRFAGALEATGWQRLNTDVTILAVHQTFESATCGPNDHRFRSADDVVDRMAVPRAFDYVAAGHIHRHQTLSLSAGDGPPIVYAGSPDRVSFAEVNEPKGSVMVEEEGGRLVHTFSEHAVRPMTVWPMDVTGLTGAQIVGQIEAFLDALPRNAVAQVRLAGSIEHSVLRGSRFTAMARALRPDVLLSLSARAVEFSHRRTAKLHPREPGSVFAHLDAPPEPTIKVSVEEAKLVPTGCGVYAAYGPAGRLLYVGKSRNIRTRVRSHLRGGTGANFFHGWARQIVHVEARPTDSELEALLIEAELIRKLRPPFNRQMRRWIDYCYLCENGKPHGQLEICREPHPRRRCFGPFRSRGSASSVRDTLAAHFRLALCPDESPSPNRLLLWPATGTGLMCERYYRGSCGGACAGRMSRSELAVKLGQRDAMLRGVDDATLRELETSIERAPDRDKWGGASEDLARQAKTLRVAFDRGARLREAALLMFGLLVLPGPEGCRKTAMLTPSGIRFDVLQNDRQDSRRILVHHERLNGSRSAERSGLLPKAVVDSFCIVARQLRQPSNGCRFISKRGIAELNDVSLLAAVFGEATQTHNAS